MAGRLNMILAAFLSLGLFWQVAPIATAADPVFNDVCKQAPTSTVCKANSSQQQSGTNPIVHTIGIVASIVAVLTGVAAVIMIILGGLALVGSGGNTENVAQARRRIMYGLVGLVVVALAWAIVHFITSHIG